VRLCGKTDGGTLLHIASQDGLVEAVRALVELGAAVNQAEVGLLEVTFRVDSVYPRDGLLCVRVSAVVGRWYARVYGVVSGKGGKMCLALCGRRDA
jgi:hypothetical protein